MTKSRYNFRGIIGEDLTAKEIRKFGKNIINYIYSNNYPKLVIIGKDNRESSDYILSVLQSELLSRGINVYTMGIVTTPELIFFTKKFKFNLGIMITASHNPYNYNGIKCFDMFGKMIDVETKDIKKLPPKNYVKAVDISKFKELYITELKNRLNLNRTNCIFDCGNGSSVDVVRKVFSKQRIIGTDTTGKYINNRNGSQDLEQLKTLCKKDKKIGFAFDGDGDRVIAIDSDGNVVDGDKIIYILASQYLSIGDRVVGTKVSSLALEKSLKNIGVNLIRGEVGAKYIERKMKKENIALGGESCGHIFTPTIDSDGVSIAIELLNILNRTNKTFQQLLKDYHKTYKYTKDFEIEKVDKVSECEQFLDNIQIIVRKSATEPKVRVYVEATDKLLAETKFEHIIEDIIVN